MHVASTKQSRHYATLHIINLKYCDYSSWTDKAFQHNQAAYWESKFNTALWFTLYMLYPHCTPPNHVISHVSFGVRLFWPVSKCDHSSAQQVWLSQWRAFNNHPCEREPNCIYMRSILSIARQCVRVCVPVLHFPSPVPPRALITKAVGAHLCESTRPGDRQTRTHSHTYAEMHIHISHANKQTSHQIVAPSNSSVGGWRSLLQALHCCPEVRTQTLATHTHTLHSPGRTLRLRMRPVGSRLVWRWLYSWVELHLGQCVCCRISKTEEKVSGGAWCHGMLFGDTHYHHPQIQNSCLFFPYKGTQVTIRMDETTQECLETEGGERAAERTSVAKQTESWERLSASQQCTAITTERKHKMETLPNPLYLQSFTAFTKMP